jgi:predicted glutamine amidotransferase
MCRLLGVVTSRPAPLAGLLAGDLDPFRGLADEHCDGWGIAHHPADHPADHSATGVGPKGAPVVRRSPRHALDGTAFTDAVTATETAAALLHLRKASAGMAVTEANTHPFAADGVALAHNGFFTPRAAVDALLPDAGAGCAGDTDSERYFALIRARLAGSGTDGGGGRPGPTPPHLALRDAAAAISGVAQVESLNALLLTPDALYAYARYEPQVVAARGGDAQSYGMAYRVDHTAGGAWRVVVASNGWEQPSPAWRPLPNGSVLEATRGGVVRVHDFGAWRRRT